MKKQKHQSSTDKMMDAVSRRAIALNRIDLLRRGDIPADMPLLGRDALLRGLEYDIDQLYRAQEDQYTSQRVRIRGLYENRKQKAARDYQLYRKEAQDVAAACPRLKRKKQELARAVQKRMLARNMRVSVKTIVRAIDSLKK